MLKKTLRSVLTVAGLTIFFLAIAIVFADRFQAIGDIVLRHFGLIGLFVSVYFLDFIIQPFPPDIPLYSFLLSGSPFFLTVLGVGVMSALGGSTGYWVGRLLEYEGAIRFIGKKKYDQAHELFLNHGTLAVVVAALTPVPFNVVCWVAGIFRMPFKPFILTVLLARIPRFFLVGALALWMA